MSLIYLVDVCSRIVVYNRRAERNEFDVSLSFHISFYFCHFSAHVFVIVMSEFTFVCLQFSERCGLHNTT